MKLISRIAPAPIKTQPVPASLDARMSIADAKPIPVRQPSEAEQRLKLALRVAALHHTYSMAQLVGIYPA